MNKHKSDSSEQQEAEACLLELLETKLNASFTQDAKLPVNTGVQPDAIDLENKIVVEVYARVGAVKGAQLHKIKGDILKLALIEKELGTSWRKVLCFASVEAATCLRGKSWIAEAARAFGLEVHVLNLPKNVREKVLSAQKRQRMINSI